MSLRHNNSLSQCPELSPVPGTLGIPLLVKFPNGTKSLARALLQGSFLSPVVSSLLAGTSYSPY